MGMGLEEASEYIVGYKIVSRGDKYFTCRTEHSYEKAMDYLADWESRGWQTIIRIRVRGKIMTL